MNSAKIDTNREYELYLRKDEHETSVYEARFDTSRNLSAAYAGSALKVLSILNGGAILAVPAVAELFKLSGEAKPVVATSIEMFCWGLIATAFGYFFAHFAMELDSRAVLQLKEYCRKGKRLDYLNRVNSNSEKINEVKEAIGKHDNSRRYLYSWVKVLQIAGTFAALIGLTFFIVGALNARAMFGM